MERGPPGGLQRLHRGSAKRHSDAHRPSELPHSLRQQRCHPGGQCLRYRQGIHHWVQSAGELTITNSNSNYGAAALAEGYRGAGLTGNDADNSAFPQDRGWAVNAIRRATDLSEETNNVRRIFLGEISAGVANNATNIDLEAAIGDANDPDNEPNLLARDNYSTRPNSRVWIENPIGDDYSSTFAAVGWSGGDTNRLVVTAGFTTPGGDAPDGTAGRPNIAGLRVYVRRVRDTRSVDERSYSLQLGNTGAGARTPLRDYITQVTTANAGISNVIPVNESTASWPPHVPGERWG